MLDEWARGRAILESIVGGEIRVGSVPGGDFAIAVAETAAEAGLRLLFTSEPTRAESDVDGLRLVGRYTIQHATSAATVRGLVRGAWMPRARQAALWNAKKLTKRVAGNGYLKVRRLLLGHGDEVRTDGNVEIVASVRFEHRDGRKRRDGSAACHPGRSANARRSSDRAARRSLPRGPRGPRGPATAR